MDEGSLREAEDEGRCPNPKIFLCIPASAADAAAVNPKGIKTLLANAKTLLAKTLLSKFTVKLIY